MAPMGGSERAAVGLAEHGHLSETSRARLEAAQRAYVTALKAAGLNPLTNPAP